MLAPGEPERADDASRPFAAVPRISLAGLPIAVIDRQQSARLMVEVALARRGSALPPPVITAANGQIISLCSRNAKTRSLYLQADLVHADGMPLVFASRYKSRTALPERVATTDLFHDVARVAELAGASFYMLGGSPAAIKSAIENVRRLYPRLAISGFAHGYFRRAGDEANAIAAVNAARPDILWVGMGAPLELAFAMRNRDRLPNVGVIKTSGGLFDFLSGRNRRAPHWMQSAGLEWLYRLGIEPRRLFYRYLTTNPHALYVLLTHGSPTSGADRLSDA